MPNKKTTKRRKTRCEKSDPMQKLCQHLAGLKAGLEEDHPHPDSPVGQIAFLLGEAILIGWECHIRRSDIGMYWNQSIEKEKGISNEQR